MEEAISEEIQDRSGIISDPAGREARIIEEHQARTIGKDYGLGLPEVYIRFEQP